MTLAKLSALPVPFVSFLPCCRSAPLGLLCRKGLAVLDGDIVGERSEEAVPFTASEKAELPPPKAEGPIRDAKSAHDLGFVQAADRLASGGVDGSAGPARSPSVIRLLAGVVTTGKGSILEDGEEIVVVPAVEAVALCTRSRPLPPSALGVVVPTSVPNPALTPTTLSLALSPVRIFDIASSFRRRWKGS